MADYSLLGFVQDANYFLDGAKSASQSLVSLTGTVGIAGFVFDIADESSVELQSEITDHYLEDGSPVQDHIALKPERVTLRGFVGEYHRIVSDKKGFLQKATEKLITIGSYLQPLSNFAKQTEEFLYKEEKGFMDYANLAGDAFKAYRNINIPSNHQSKAFLFFEALRNSKQTFTIQTPYRYYTDMAIESLKAIQTGETRDETNFEVTMKKLRYVTLKTRKYGNEKKEGRLEGMVETMKNNGRAFCEQPSWDSFKGIFNV